MYSPISDHCSYTAFSIYFFTEDAVWYILRVLEGKAKALMKVVKKQECSLTVKVGLRYSQIVCRQQDNDMVRLFFYLTLSIVWMMNRVWIETFKIFRRE